MMHSFCFDVVGFLFWNGDLAWFPFGSFVYIPFEWKLLFKKKKKKFNEQEEVETNKDL